MTPILRTRADLAGWTGEAGEPAEALRLYQELLPDLERVLGPDHPDTVRISNNVAALQWIAALQRQISHKG